MSIGDLIVLFTSYLVIQQFVIPFICSLAFAELLVTKGKGI